ncbi:NADPH-dependent FMN reductase [Pedobacter sp. Du54]|uniref:NADPH-dependent FMN reductase n=1 Tax=Pedobacter anseongensis TaxID=3133439 RepID=UPI00309C050D
MSKKQLLAILGSTSTHSANKRLLNYITSLSGPFFEVATFDGIDKLPHFNPDLDGAETPSIVIQFRQQLIEADGLLICTPEYVFSLPGSLKNAIEWCVSTTILSNKPTGLLVAAASGLNALEELKLVMQTLEAKFTDETILLIQGIKGKINAAGEISDIETANSLINFLAALNDLVDF